MVVVLLVLILLAVAGLLGLVIKVALGVALGIFLAVTVLTAIVGWRVRRALYGPKWRRVRGSRGSSVEVLDRHNRS
ncbi:MAG TPA: hypothetical protein DIT48_00340 [Actinobacteria bacterium]|jgi:membrane protein implicated in regulation of membrane protease activity|nr:hypothetical protein [Actinomycetota bacterium]HCP61735.1 hypothetical protein [Actinomycetota bacterium]